MMMEMIKLRFYGPAGIAKSRGGDLGMVSGEFLGREHCICKDIKKRTD